MTSRMEMSMGNIPNIDKVFLIRYHDEQVNRLDIEAETRLATLAIENNNHPEMEAEINAVRQEFLDIIMAACDANLRAYNEGYSGLQAFEAGGMCVYIDKATVNNMWPTLLQLRWREPGLPDENEKPLGALVILDSHFSLKFLNTLKGYLDNNRTIREMSFKQTNLDKDILYAAMLRSTIPSHIVRPDLSQCTELYLSYQQIATVDDGLWSNTPGLKKLNLSFNPLRHINKDTFKGLDRLEELRLKEASISVIEPDAFKHMNQLKHLDLTFNSLDHVDVKMLAGLCNMEWLSFDFNRIKHIESESFANMKKLRELRLSGHFCETPFNMSCLTGLSNQLEMFISCRADYRTDYDDDFE